MKNTLLILPLLANAFSVYAEESKLIYKAAATIQYTNSSEYEFLSRDTTKGSYETEASIYAQYPISDTSTVKGLASTDPDKVYFNFDFLFPEDAYQYGVRVGRVNRNSGAYTNLGPSVDLMNYLPQGSCPQRQGSLFYRTDGVQAYFDTIVGGAHAFTLTATYGKPVVRLVEGAGTVLFFAFTDVNTLKVDVDPVKFVDFIYSYKGLQLFADYFSFDASAVAEATSSTLPLDISYDFITYKYGASYSIGATLDVVVQKLYEGLKYKEVTTAVVPEGYLDGTSLTVTYTPINNLSVYAGASKAETIFKNRQQALSILEFYGVQPWLLNSDEAFIGARWELKDVVFIVDYRKIDGILFLNARYEHDRNFQQFKRYWSVISASISYYF